MPVIRGTLDADAPVAEALAPLVGPDVALAADLEVPVVAACRFGRARVLWGASEGVP